MRGENIIKNKICPMPMITSPESINKLNKRPKKLIVLMKKGLVLRYLNLRGSSPAALFSMTKALRLKACQRSVI
jgi:hypothetical protein